MSFLKFRGLKTTVNNTVKVILLVGITLLTTSANASASGKIVGMQVDDFELIDQNGVAHRLYYYSDAPAIVLMTQGNGCPMVKDAVPGLHQARADFADARFFLMNSNLEDDQASIVAEANKIGFDLPVLIDRNQLVGESLLVTRTAEVFVIDPKTRKVVYHGTSGDKLKEALSALSVGKQVAVSEVEGPGCEVSFPEREMKQQHASISYSETIAPLLEDKCIGCHQKGGIGPWAMSSYEMVKGFAPMIREVIRTDRMPPWHADPSVGHFLRDKSLSSKEIKTLVHWIEAGSPRGAGVDPLAAPRAPLQEWPLGKPDLIVKLPAFDVPATGVVDYQYPVIENPLTEAKWLRASTVKVGARETVHHVLNGIMKEKPKNGGRGQSRWGPSIGGYAVGAESSIARENVGTYLPAGGYIGFQIHYTPFGKAVTDETEIGLYFYDEDKTPNLMVRTSVVIDASIEIPPGTANHEEVAYKEFPKDAVLFSAFPHAHYRGQSSTLTLMYPDGEEKLLLSLPRYDFNWQRSYEFIEPVDVPAGSKLIARYTYDNSKQNPANPNAGDRVTWGEQSHEEMLFTAFAFRWKEETSTNQREDYQKLMREDRLFGMMDDNLNGTIERSELRGIVGKRFGAGFQLLDTDADGSLTKAELAAMPVARR